MGSVKDLEVLKNPTREKMGVGRFHFSDRYSVFDWGQMPDQIDRKGQALCLMGAHCFEQLEKEGIKTHYRGLMDSNGDVTTVAALDRPSDTMEVCLVNVYRPRAFIKDRKLHYDYSFYSSNMRNYLIPLEIIYRNGLPEGSSVFKRLDQGQTTLEELELPGYPKSGERLVKPIFDVSTKLEEKDRYVSWKEAREIAGLSMDEMEETRHLLLRVNEVITNIAAKAGLRNEDGKIELAFDPERRLMIVDVVGTLDECRFTYEGLHVSKEIARLFYRNTGWFNDVEEAKRHAEIQGIKEWKSLVRSNPPELDNTLKRIISEMYMAVSNEVIGKRLFDASSLREIVEKYGKYMELNKTK